MLLSELVGKSVYSGNNRRGICRGVCLSLKSRAVKYLLCSEDPLQNACAEFSVGTNHIADVGEEIRFRRLRVASPRGCARFYTGRPVYSEEGAYLGVTADLVMENFTASKLIVDSGKSYSAAAIAALGDAVILHREPRFPLGVCAKENLPFPDSVKFPANDASVSEAFLIRAGMPVTRGTLRAAIAAGMLIRLTIGLLPFPRDKTTGSEKKRKAFS